MNMFEKPISHTWSQSWSIWLVMGPLIIWDCIRFKHLLPYSGWLGAFLLWSINFLSSLFVNFSHGLPGCLRGPCRARRIWWTYRLKWIVNLLLLVSRNRAISDDYLRVLECLVKDNWWRMYFLRNIVVVFSLWCKALCIIKFQLNGCQMVLVFCWIQLYLLCINIRLL